MAFVEDRWFKKDKKTKKPEHGQGLRWRVVWQETDGRRRSQSFKRKDAAKDKRTSVDHTQRSGEYVAPEDAKRTLGDYWPRFERIKSGKSKSTRVGYTNAWANHIAPEWGSTPVRDLRGPAVEEWLAGLTRKGTDTPLSASSKDKIHIVLAGLCELAIDDGVIPRSPLAKVKVGRGRTRERRYLTVAQADALAEAMKPYDLKIWVLLFTAIRRGEAAGLKGRDLDVRRKRLRISRDVDAEGNEDDTKSGRHRDVPVPDSILAHLAEVAKAAGPDGWLFPAPDGGPWTRDSWRNVWERNRGASGYTDLDTHELRHTAVAWAIQAGANVKTIQRMVGHASAATTLDIYGHLMDDSLDDVVAKVAEMVRAERSGNACGTHEGPAPEA